MQISSILRFIFLFSASLLLAAGIGWGGLALWYDGFEDSILAGLSAAGFVLFCLVILLRVRPYLKAVFLTCIPLLFLICWWLSISPSKDRDWVTEVSRSPHAQFNGNIVTVHNVRNFDYSSDTDFTERWETRRYDLNKLVGVDLFFSYWGPRLIAHTITSWEFADGSHLAVSIEIRREKGETYSAVRGFFRQFELYYVVADEQDLIGVRANHRDEEVFLYRIKTSKQKARALLIEFLEEVNRLYKKPRWYNALRFNCTTTIRHHVKQVAPVKPWNWRILANGHLDELGYMRGSVDTSMPFPELRARSNITKKVRAADQQVDFSAYIREDLPER